MKKFIFLLLISNTAYATCFIRDVLPVLRPGAEWFIKNDDFVTLQWRSTQKVPTRAEIDQAIATCQQQEAAAKVQLDQAKIDLNDSDKTATERIDAMIKYLDLKN